MKVCSVQNLSLMLLQRGNPLIPSSLATIGQVEGAECAKNVACPEESETVYDPKSKREFF